MDLVVERVAGAGEAAAAGEAQLLDIGAERISGERGADLVGALARILDHAVADIVDEIDVVAGAAAHRVGAGAAVELVVAAMAVQGVVAAEAEDLVRAPVPLSVSSPPVPLMIAMYVTLCSI